jgi:hypothetical protein
VTCELREEVKRPYTKPEVVRYGTIESLTAGGSGSKSDGSALSAVPE